MSEDKNIPPEMNADDKDQHFDPIVIGSDQNKPEPVSETNSQKFPEDRQAPIVESPETTNQKSQIADMELHHYAHVHEKKKWKEYLFQFLMLFLAVFCGFLAEYKLEHTIEHQREKKFIRSLIEDLKLDTTTINSVTAFNKRTFAGMDSLTRLIWSTNITKENAKQLYHLKFTYTGFFRRVLFSKSTLTQLKYSGNLRLIKQMHVADSILKYDLAIEFIDKFADQIENYLSDNYKAEYEIFSDKFWPGNFSSAVEYQGQGFDLLSYDPKVLAMYASRLTHQSASVRAYVQAILPPQKQRAISLIELLKKEYHLK